MKEGLFIQRHLESDVALRHLQKPASLWGRCPLVMGGGDYLVVYRLIPSYSEKLKITASENVQKVWVPRLTVRPYQKKMGLDT